jgi:mannose-6-phosphate isomerase
MAQPTHLPSNQFDHFYRGGYRIGKLRNGPGGPMRPEEWIGSCTTRFGEAITGLSKLPSGEYLRDAIAANPTAWLGDAHVAAFGTSIEVLVKLLDPDQRLPVHYHPNKKFAKQHLALDHGKTEAWIILEAPAGSGVGLGFAEAKSKSQVESMIKAMDSKAMINSLHRIEVSVGDAILVPAGTPHAIDEGIFVLELQEPTDLSILLEWEGFAVDGLVDGHLGLGFDLALDALNLNPLSESEISQLVTRRGLSGGSARSIFTSAADDFFRADLLPGDGAKVAAGYGVFLTLEGSGTMSFAAAPEVSVTRGDAIVIPYSAGEWALHGATGIVARPPLAN